MGITSCESHGWSSRPEKRTTAPISSCAFERTSLVRSQEVLEDLGALRRRAPAFLEVYSFEANVARRLYESSGDKSYLERGIAVALEARKRAPSDPRPLANLFYIYLEAGRYLEAEKVLEQLEDIDPAGSLFKRGLLIESQGHPEEGSGSHGRGHAPPALLARSPHAGQS